MIEKHQQANGIGRGKITINPEYIRRAGEITVGGLPIKVLSSNPNTGRVLAQFPDGHTEEVKAAPDYFIGGNTSTKELKNNLPIYGETNTAANERADSLDEAHDLTPIFSNLITAGQAPVVNEGAENIKKGNYLLGASLIASPLMFGSGAVGTAARSGVGLYNLANENGVRKTVNNFSEGNYGQGALSLLGDAFNVAMATEGLGSISNALKGTSGYRNWRLAREINLATKNKPNISVTADAGTTTNQGTTALSLEEILKAFNQARQWHLNRINSPGYTQRALRAGFTEEEIPQLLQQLTSLINRLKLLTPEEVLGPNIRRNPNANGKASAEYWKANVNGNLKQGIAFYNTNASYDDAVSNFIHEFGHGATFGLNGTETSGYTKALADQFPLINRAVKYNRSLYPEVTEETVRKVLPSAAKTENLGYYAMPTEMLSRGYEFMRDYVNNWWKLKNSGNSFTGYDVMNNAANSRFNSKLFRGLTGDLGAYNFQKNALGISVPLGLGYGLYNTNDLLQQLLSLKQGGKINTVEQFKNGSKIHIKKKNRGKFTDYCGGEVTQECIRKAKASGNPTLVKRATFADNARKWKHKEGGKAFVEGVNVLDSNPTAYKYVKKKYKMALEGTKLTFGLKVSNVGNWINNNLDIVNTAVNGITGFISANKKSKAADQFAKAKEAEMKSFKEKTWKEKYMENLLAQEDRSDVVNMSRAYNQTSGDVAQAVQEKLLKIDSQIAAAQLKAAQARGNAWKGILKGAGEIAMNALASNGIPKSKTSPTSLTGLKTSSFGGMNTPQFTSPQTNYSFLK